jgi:hypothetical protein
MWGRRKRKKLEMVVIGLIHILSRQEISGSCMASKRDERAGCNGASL